MRVKEIQEIIEDLEYVIGKVEDIPGVAVVDVKKKVKEIKQDLLETVNELKENHTEK